MADDTFLRFPVSKTRLMVGVVVNLLDGTLVNLVTTNELQLRIDVNEQCLVYNVSGHLASKTVLLCRHTASLRRSRTMTLSDPE
jgi:hypothetical protein